MTDQKPCAECGEPSDGPYHIHEYADDELKDFCGEECANAWFMRFDGQPYIIEEEAV